MKAGKLFKRMLVCVMMALVLGALSGCGEMTAEEIVEKYAENNLSVDNCEATMKMDMEMAQEDSEDTYKISVDSDMQIMVSPEYKAHMLMNMDMGTLGTYDVDTYIVKVDDTYYTYMYSMDTWMKQEIDIEDIDTQISSYKDQINMDIYIDNMKNFTLAGEETVGDKETYKIEGTISGDSLQEVFAQTDLTEYAAVDTDTLDFSTLGDLTISLWLSKEDFVPVKIYMDMSEMMNTIMESQGLGITVPTCTMEIEYTSFGTVTDITLPDDAADAISLDDIDSAD